MVLLHEVTEIRLVERFADVIIISEGKIVSEFGMILDIAFELY